MGEIADFAKNLVQPVTKLIECASKGIGMVYEPRYTRKMADARRYEINQISEVIRDNCDVIGSYSVGGIALNLPEFADFVNRAEYRSKLNMLKEQQNIENVLDETYQLLEGTDAVTSEPVDEDWLNRFFNSAKEVSNEEMQIIWARILAEEIKKPNTYSLRTLEALRNMKREEAVLFQKVYGCTVTTGRFVYLPRYDNYIKTCGIRFEDIKRLDECGLLSSSGTESVTLSGTGTVVLAHNESLIIVITFPEESEQKLTVPAHILSYVGKEISNIIENKITDELLMEFAKEVKLSNPMLKVSIHRILSKNKGDFLFEDEDLLSS